MSHEFGFSRFKGDRSSNGRHIEHKRKAKAWALLPAVALVASAFAVPAFAVAGDTSFARGQYLSGNALNGIDLSALVEVVGEQAESTGTAPETNQSNLNLELLSASVVNIPGGVQVPLSFANAGVVSQYAHAGTDASSVGASGLVSDQGVIGTAVDGANPPGPLTADLSEVLAQLGLSATIDTASLSVGATAARAEIVQGGVPTGTYQVDGATLSLHSPLVANISTAVNAAVGNLQTAVDALVGPTGSLATGVLSTVQGLVPGAGLGSTTATVTISPSLATQVSTLLAAPLVGGGVTVDLATGQITADLAQLSGGLNGQAPNTNVLSGATLTALSSQVTTLISNRLAAINTAVSTAVSSATVNLDITLTAPLVGNALRVQFNGTLSQLAAGSPAPTVAALGLAVPLGLDAALTSTLGNLATAVLDTAVPAFSSALTSQVTAVTNTLAPVIDSLDAVATLLVNVQDTAPTQGQLFSETAVRIGLLPGPNVATLNLATAIVGPNVVASAPSILSLTPPSGPATGGTSVVVTGSGFTNASQVLVDGVPVSFVITDDSHVTLTTDSHTPATVDVSVVTPNGTATLPDSFTFTPASISGITPTSGPEAGGTTVVITGTCLAGATDVAFGGAVATFTIDSDTQITATTPPGTGTVDVLVVTGGACGNATLPAAFTYLPTPPAPTALSLTPASGPEAGGTVVTITGSNFVVGSTTVNVDGVSVPATVLSPTSLTFTTPAHVPGTVPVSVTTPGGTSGNVPGGFTFLATPPAPTATSLTPDNGPVAGGTTVTVTGSGFVPGATTVTIGGFTVPATVTSSTQLTFVTPAHVPGNVAVSVTTPNGTSADVPGGYTYTLTPPPTPTATSLTPGNGPEAGGTVVTITGSNFVVGSTTVNVDGVSVPATVLSPTSLTFTTPAHAPGTVPVSVTTPGGTSGNVPGGFTFDPTPPTPPTATSLTPTHGPAAGGTEVTISGSGFVPGATTVTIDGVSVPATVLSPTSLTFTTPAHAPGTVPVSVTTPGGTSGNVPGGFTFDPATVTGVTPPTGPAGGGTTVTIFGSCFVNVTDVTFGGVSAASFTVDSPTQITAVTPAGVGVVDVAVISSGDCGTGNGPGGFTYIPAPALLSLIPDHGPASGGTTVDITGSHFSGATEVAIDGVPVASFTIVSDTQIRFVTPAHPAETVDVSVTSPGGTGTLADSYTFDPMAITELDPNFGPEQGGNVITIAGSCFTGVTEVWFGNVQAPWFEVVSDTQLRASLPSGTGVVDVRVVGSTECSNASVDDGYTYEPAVASGWTIAMTPNQGPDTGGTFVTLTTAPQAASVSAGTQPLSAGVGATALADPLAVGFNPLQNADWVTVGGVPVEFTQVNDTTITFVTPAHGATTEEVVVTNAAGVSPPMPFTFIPTAVPVNPASDPGPELAATGSDSTGLLWLVIAALIGGTALTTATTVTARRRRNR